MDGALHNGNTVSQLKYNNKLRLTSYKTKTRKKMLQQEIYTLHTFTHQQSHSTIAIQREGRNENVEKGEEKVYSVMDDIFSNMERLNNVFETRKCRAGFKILTNWVPFMYTSKANRVSSYCWSSSGNTKIITCASVIIMEWRICLKTCY